MGHQLSINGASMGYQWGINGTSVGTSSRIYLTTHPWLTFQVDLRKASPKLWILLGEARSKCEHIVGVPLRPSVSEELHKVYLAKAARATTAIEGNTLSEDEVRQIVEGTLDLPPSQQYLRREVDNIVAAYNSILDELAVGPARPLTSRRINDFNRRVLDGLDLDEGVAPGETRTHSVVVGKYRGAPAEDCDYLLDRLSNWLNGPDFSDEQLGTGLAIVKAAIAHLYLAWIHPFGDGNGRTARLIEYQILVSSGIPSPAAHLMSNHYNETRSEYYHQLDRSIRTDDGYLGFLQYALQGFVDGLDGQLKLIMYQQWEIAWENYVHDTFHGLSSQTDTRRRHLVLDLSKRVEPIPVRGLSSLSPRLAEAYAGKTRKTLTRDVNALIKMGLIERTREGVVPLRHQILAFLPKMGPAPGAERVG
jgi:Fic family protein